MNAVGVNTSHNTMGNKMFAEIDAMDMDSLKENGFWKNLHSGSCSAASNKTPNVDLEKNFAHWMVASSGEVRPQKFSRGSVKNHRLETDEFCVHVEHACPNADPSKCWSKRLKLTPSSSAQGTKGSNMAEISPCSRKSKSTAKAPKKSIIILEPIPTKLRGQEPSRSDTSGDSSKGNEDEPENSSSKDSLLSHAWIQRWLHIDSSIAERKAKPLICKPESSKSAPGQFPSLAAMALVGKAATGFRHDIHKKGYFTVWETKTF